MDRTPDQTPSGVPQATQAGSIYDRWPWVEPSVWTERMLNALEKGVKGGVWFSLIDKSTHLPLCGRPGPRSKPTGGQRASTSKVLRCLHGRQKCTCRSCVSN